MSWNPATGCTKVSAGCANCYAERFAERWRGIAGHPYEHGFDLQLRPERLDRPLRWRRPRRVFVDSMTDLFHEGIPDEYVRRVFDVMLRSPCHIFHVFTKRHERLLQLAPSLPWPRHVWLGVTVERDDYVCRADALRQVPTAVRFVCAEPLLGALPSLDLRGIDWVVAGGESGPRRRPPEVQWLRDLRDACLAAGVPFFFKGWGGRVQGALGRELDGREWSSRPSRQQVSPAEAVPSENLRLWQE